MNNIQSLLNQVGIIVKKNNEILDATGGRFNVFNIIGLASDEVRLHSALLAELLRPNGTHGLKDEFLKEFVTKIINKEKPRSQSNDDSIDLIDNKFASFNFDCDGAKVKVEEFIGNVTETIGGRIDIIITDKNNNAIIIENKIYAGDQNAQLIRYDNYAKNNHTGKYKILYLTLYGHEASKGSGEGVQYTSISYAEDIKDWLEICLKIAVHLPLVRETINQYISLIKQLTGQSNTNKMKDEIIQLLQSDSTYVNSAIEIIKAVNDANIHCKVEFFKELNLKIKKQIELDDSKISIRAAEDVDGVCIYYDLQNLDNSNISNSEKGKYYATILRDIKPNMNHNNWHIGWYNPEPFKRYQKFSSFDQQKIFEFYIYPNKMIELIKIIGDNNDLILSEFLNRISSYSESNSDK